MAVNKMRFVPISSFGMLHNDPLSKPGHQLALREGVVHETDNQRTWKRQPAFSFSHSTSKNPRQPPHQHSVSGLLEAFPDNLLMHNMISEGAYCMMECVSEMTEEQHLGRRVELRKHSNQGQILA